MRPTRIGNPTEMTRPNAISTQFSPRSEYSPTLIATELSTLTGTSMVRNRRRSTFAAAVYRAITMSATNSGQ